MTGPELRERLARVCRSLRFLWPILVLAHAGFIWWSSSRTWEEELPDLALDWSNFLHFPLYGGLGVWLHLAFDGARKGGLEADRAAAAAALFGLADELHQATVPGRDFSLHDVLTDLAGAFFFVTLLNRVLQGPDFRPDWRRRLVLALALGLISSFALPEILPDL